MLKKFSYRALKVFVFFILLGAVSLSFLQYTQAEKTCLRFLDQEGTEHVFSVSLQEKKRLLCFMRLLLAEDDFAYTLLGSKPVSWACYKSPFPFADFSLFCDSWSRYNRTLRLGWQVWLKYRHLFPVALWVEKSKSHPGWASIFIVNEEQFNQVVNENKRDFQEVLHREIIDGFQLLKEMKNCSLVDDILQRHQGLIGTVLGYGRNNSWDFLERSEKREILGCVWDELGDENSQQIKTRNAMDTEDSIFLHCYPSFAGHPNSEESLKLKAEYLLTQQKIIDYYKGKDFLEATLSLLAGYRP